MADDVLLRDRIEIERKRDDHARLDRINGVEKDFAVLKTLFDATIKSILEKLGDAVSDEDLKTLQRELETKMNEAVSGLRHEIERSNEAWAEKILTGARMLNAEAENQRHQEQKVFGRQIALTVFAAALSIIGAIFLLWLQTGKV